MGRLGRPTKMNMLKKEIGNFKIKSQIPTSSSYYINVKCSVLKNYDKLDTSELHKKVLRLIHKHIKLEPRFMLDVIPPDDNKNNKCKTGTATVSLCLYRPLSDNIVQDRDENMEIIEGLLDDLTKIYAEFNIEVCKPVSKRKKTEQ